MNVVSESKNMFNVENSNEVIATNDDEKKILLNETNVHFKYIDSTTDDEFMQIKREMTNIDEKDENLTDNVQSRKIVDDVNLNRKEFLDETSYQTDFADIEFEMGKMIKYDDHIKYLFTCIHCNKTFSHPNYLEVHSRTHTGEKPFVCLVCGRQFSQRANLNRHALGHSGEKPHLCHICGKSFIQKTQLYEHILQHSDNININYKCHVCSEMLNDRLSLQQHVIEFHPHQQLQGFVEKNSKSNVCETCGKSYTTMGGLRMHIRLHTGHLYPCTKCEKSYVNQALLHQHLRTHTREKTYECETCGKAFIYKNALTVHMRVHTGEKPYKCLMCGTSYTQFGHLQSHKKTHTGEKPFSCHLCGKSYRQKVDLRLHNNRIHREERDSKKTSSTETQTVSDDL